MIDVINGKVDVIDEPIYIACFFVEGDLQEVFTSLRELPNTPEQIIANVQSYLHDYYADCKKATVKVFKSDQPSDPIFEAGVF